MAKKFKGISGNAEFDGILISAIVEGALKLIEKIPEGVEKELLIDYINQLHKGIRQRDEVVKTLITHIKNIEKKEAK